MALALLRAVPRLGQWPDPIRWGRLFNFMFRHTIVSSSMCSFFLSATPSLQLLLAFISLALIFRSLLLNAHHSLGFSVCKTCQKLQWLVLCYLGRAGWRERQMWVFLDPWFFVKRCLANEHLHYEAQKRELLHQSQRTTAGCIKKQQRMMGMGRLDAKKNALKRICGLHVCSRFQMVRKGV